jgi:hypothetical protein
MTVLYDMAMSTTKTTQTSTTTTTVLQNGVAFANVRTGLSPDPPQTCPSYASTRNTSQPPPFMQSRLTSNELQPQSASPYLPSPYVTPAPMPALRAASVPLYQPKPTRPLPEWAKSSFVLDQLLPQISLDPYAPTTLAHAIPSPPRASSTFLAESCEWAYGAPVANATIEEMIDPRESSFNNDDDEYDDGDDEDTDMEGTERGFEIEKLSGFDMEMPEFHISPADPPAFHGTLSSAAAPLSSSSLLCQPIPDVVQNQFRPPATRTIPTRFVT